MDRPEITPAAIVATAERLGIALEPGQYLWYCPDGRDGGPCGCAAGVAALVLRPDWAGRDLGTGDLFHAGLDPEAACGLSDGFEGEPFNPPDGRRAADAVAIYRRHYRIGRAVAEAVAATPIGA